MNDEKIKDSDLFKLLTDVSKETSKNMDNIIKELMENQE